MIPSTMRMRALRQHMQIEVAVAGLTPPRPAPIAAKLREIFAVIEVDLTTELASAA